jgi:hypothetical protein
LLSAACDGRERLLDGLDGLDPIRAEPARRDVAVTCRRAIAPSGAMVRSTGLEPVTLSFEG